MKRLILFAAGLLFTISVNSQILKPVKWSYAANKTSKTQTTLYLKATIDEGWHIYSQNVPEGGPMKTSFNFVTSKAYKPVGKTIEPKAIVKFEKSFDMNVAILKDQLFFSKK